MGLECEQGDRIRVWKKIFRVRTKDLPDPTLKRAALTEDRPFIRIGAARLAELAPDILAKDRHGCARGWTTLDRSDVLDTACPLGRTPREEQGTVLLDLLKAIIPGISNSGRRDHR